MTSPDRPDYAELYRAATAEVEKQKAANRELFDQLKTLVASFKALQPLQHDSRAGMADMRRELGELNQRMASFSTGLDCLNQEVQTIQDHNRDLTIRLYELGQHDQRLPPQSWSALELLLMRKEGTGIRPSPETLQQEPGRICLISSLPKSGTWSMQYFWSILDLLCRKGRHFDPFAPFFFSLPGLEVKLFGISHFHCPGFENHLAPEVRQKLDAIRYPGPSGFDWGGEFLREQGFDEVIDPTRNKNAKIVFMYRNPMDQMISYARSYAVPVGQEPPLDAPLDEPFVFDQAGEGVDVRHLKHYIRQGGAAAYLRYFYSFYAMKDVLKDDLLFVRYEDLLQERQATLKKMAEFFLSPVKGNVLEDELPRAMEITSLENMKLLEAVTGKGITHQSKIPREAHLRDGKVARWREILDQEDIDFIFGLLDDLGIERDYFRFD